jgi:hypothetical protein
VVKKRAVAACAGIAADTARADTTGWQREFDNVEAAAMRKLRDLGLTYEEALHGIQTAVLHDMHVEEHKMVGTWDLGPPEHAQLRTNDRHSCGPKHLRVGHDCRASDHMALVSLLIERGILTEEEYVERVRLALNDELAGREGNHPGVKFR